MTAASPATDHYSAVVVGGGQAGLSASYWLTRAGLDHVVLEKKTTMSCRAMITTGPIRMGSW